MARPLLLLDVDGVLNPFGTAEPPDGYDEHHVFPGEEPVRVNPVHGLWITEAREVLDVVWATGWNEEANEVLAPLLHIEPLPVVTMPAKPFAPSAKVPAVADHVGDRPAAWIDDVHTVEGRRWAAARGTPTLLIPVEPAAGLTRDAVDRAMSWARGLCT